MKYSQDTDNNTELIIGIIGPIGCNRELVITTIKDLATHFNYKVKIIKISEIIKSVSSNKIEEQTPFLRVMSLMNAGNKLRKDSQDNSILAKMAAIKIHKVREETDQEKTIYIVDSIKHPEEVNALRDIYGNGFFLFAVHSSETQRNIFLEQHCHILDIDERQKLLDRDKDEDLGYGQSTSTAFHLADFFVTEDGDNNKMWNSLERYFDLIFGHPFRTPTFQEYAMFMAHAASIRSADLSRQVGAVLTKNKDIISSGSNECPKAFGGTYWPKFNNDNNLINDHEEGRDYMLGDDYNAKEKSKIINQLIHYIPDDIIERLQKNINKSGIKDITEYGRVVHAEMDAILGCSRRGVSTQNSIMFCTTYPCHNCAKHIIATGIKKVIYIEPYPKSKALDMHPDSISTDTNDSSKKVIFKPFIGVGPRQYINLFSMHLSDGKKLRRKAKGESNKIEWEKSQSTPRVKMYNKSYIEIEKYLESKIELSKKI